MPANKPSRINDLYKDNAPKKKPESDKDADLLREARERARDGAAYWKDNWNAAESDLKFLNGEQWPEQVKIEREEEGRPCLVNNVLPTFVDQVLGDQRQNRPAIKVSAVDTKRVNDVQTGEPTELRITSMAGKDDYSLAETFTGVIKNIEYNCDAETEYDIAFQSAVESGMGFLRTRADYTSDDSFEQDLIIESIENQFSVIMDYMAKKRDYSDQNWCFINDVMEKTQFEKQYPGSTSEALTDDCGDWFGEKTVRVSEYFTREPVTREIALMSDGASYYLDEIEDIVDELLENNISIKRTRKVKTHKTYWRKISAHDVLEGPIEVPCSTIPVVPVWGKATVIKKKKYFRSIIRNSKDAQRMANYWDSAATEAVALAPKAPFTGQAEHFEGWEQDWETANTKNHAILRWNSQGQGDQGPRRAQPAMMPAAELTMAGSSSDKIKSTLGMYDASLGAMGNETSGKAIIARQRQGDRGSFAYIDNLTKSIRRVGKILVEMIPKIYDTERVVRLKFADETEDFVKLNESIYDDEGERWVTIHDLSVQKYDVVVTTGPAFATQRIEAAEAMIQFAQAVPAAAAVMADLIAQNMDWPNADALAARLKKVIPPNVLSQDEREEIEKDMPEPKQEQPTPEQQVDMAKAEAAMRGAEADIAEAEADKLKAQLETDDAKAKLAQIEQMANGGDQFFGQVREMIAQAIAELQIQSTTSQ